VCVEACLGQGLGVENYADPRARVRVVLLPKSSCYLLDSCEREYERQKDADKGADQRVRKCTSWLSHPSAYEHSSAATRSFHGSEVTSSPW